MNILFNRRSFVSLRGPTIIKFNIFIYHILGIDVPHRGEKITVRDLGVVDRGFGSRSGQTKNYK
jgi:hypothetical protein